MMKGKGRYRRNRNKKEAKKMLSPVVGLMDIRSPHFSAVSDLSRVFPPEKHTF